MSNVMNSQKFYFDKRTRLLGLKILTFSIIGFFFLSDRIVYRRCPFFEPPSWANNPNLNCDSQFIFAVILSLICVFLFQVGICKTIPYAWVYEISSKGIKHRNVFRTEFISIENIKKAAVKNRKGYEILEVSLNNRSNLKIFNLDKADEFCNTINKLVVNYKK